MSIREFAFETTDCVAAMNEQSVFVERGDDYIKVYSGADIPLSAIPSSLDKLQFRLQATAMGLRDAIESYVANAHQNVKDWYANTETFEIDNPMLLDGVRALNAEALLPEFFRLGAMQPAVRR